MTTREYLESVEELDNELNEKLIQIQNIRDMATNTSPVQGDGSSHLGVSDKVGNAIEQIIDMQIDADKLNDKFVNLKEEIISIISKMYCEVNKTVLYDRYIKYDKCSKIADKLTRESDIKYSDDYVRTNITLRAIREFEMAKHNMLRK